ncbi:hypothetical protein PUNSTDRAFT_65728, partial [Punctularia strigosozonata HHB-11173 SS5]|uniref:uncharacterized protein n=1 Tax=Punctularia strigosozonata (strain HHB-11173) TaxID=741275 RepID=UPI0004416820
VSSPTPSEDRRQALIAAASAAERRIQQATPDSDAAFGAEREKRQAFRRLIDPGIMRPNGREQAVDSLKVLKRPTLLPPILSTLAENLLREPENPKFQQFKPTNDTIKKKVVERQGVLEYAIALGFRAEVKNFQPYYVFNQRHMDDLRIGAAMLREALELQTGKMTRQERAKKEEKAAADAVAKNVHLAFIDDRKAKLLRDEREKQLREARAAAAARGVTVARAGSDDGSDELDIPGSTRRMPGSGYRLTDSSPAEADDDPPAYDGNGPRV